VIEPPVIVKPCEVARPTALTPPANVDVAVVVDTTTPVVTLPDDREEIVPEIDLKIEAKKFVEVAFVIEALMNVDVAVVVAVKYELTVSPTTDNFAYGLDVPMPTFESP